MAFDLSAPETRREWLVVLAGLVPIYAVLFYATSSDLVHTASMSLFSAVLMTAALLVLVFVWRGTRRTFGTDEIR